MKGFVQWNPFMVRKNPPPGGLEPISARSLAAGRYLTTELRPPCFTKEIFIFTSHIFLAETG